MKPLRIHYYQIGKNECLLVSLAWRRASTFTARLKSSMTLLNSLSISSIRWIDPPNVLPVVIRFCHIDRRSLRTKMPAFDIVAGIFCNFLHYSEHLRDCLLQDFRFFFFFLGGAVRVVLQPGSYKPVGETWPDSRPNPWTNKHGLLELSHLGSQMKLS